MSSRLGRRPVYQLIITSRCFSFFFLCSFILLLQPFFRHENWSTDLRILFRLHHATSQSEQAQWIVFCFFFNRFIPTVNFLMNLLAHTDSDYFFLKYAWYGAMLVPRTCGSHKKKKKVSNPHARFILILTAVIYFDGFQENRWQKPTARRCRLSCSHTIVWPVFFFLKGFSQLLILMSLFFSFYTAF